MPRTIRFHLDENCGNAIAEGLRRRGIDATTTHDAGLIGASDEGPLAYAQINGRGLFTQDGDFLGIHHAGVPHAGIAYCPMEQLGIGDVVRGLADLWDFLEPEEMVERVEFL